MPAFLTFEMIAMLKVIPSAKKQMKFSLLLLCSIVLTAHTAFGQATIDTTYIETYPQEISISSFLSNNFIEINESNEIYRPNNLLKLGLGVSVKNTILNFRYDFGIAQVGGKDHGKTESIDFQIHRYGRRLMLDLFFLRYKGFYQGIKELKLHPNLSVQQIGAEGSYLFNSNQFSAKAAFEQSEKQLKSAGSFILGGGTYLYKIRSDKNLLATGNNYISNFQLGMNAGYAYSWVLNNHWLLSGMAKGGINLGNEPELLKHGKIKAYPTGFARGSAAYHRSDWAVSFLMLVNNKSLFPSKDNKLDLTSANFELSYVKHFDNFLKKKKKR